MRRAKRSVIKVVRHGLGESAAIMRAVNCAVRRGNKYIGENADGKGFLMSLEGVVDARGKRIVLFGAGGAARAIGVGLALAGAHSISVVNPYRRAWYGTSPANKRKHA